jgi:anti-sigma factor RsiW
MTSTITDSDLHAWLDGELSIERRAQVEAWLQDRPEDAARLRLWAADRDVLKLQFDALLDEPVPQRLADIVRRRGAGAARSAPWQRWAAAFAVFALGGIVGAGLVWRQQSATLAAGAAGLRTQPAAWVQRAAVAHAVYVPEVRHPVEVKAQEEHLSRWLTKRLDVDVKLFDLRAQGFELVGGRLLPDAAGPSAQLMYQAIQSPDAAASAAGGDKPARVTVYLRKPDDATSAAFRYEQRGELGLFYWVEGDSAHGRPCGYALVGALPREKLLALAEAIYKQGENATQ